MRCSCLTISRILLWATPLTPLSGINPLRAEEALPVLSASPVRMVEGASGTTTVLVPLYLPAAAAAAPVTVAWTTADGTATAGSDYTAASGILTFAPGEVLQSVRVDVIGDTTDEEDEFFTINLSSPGGATLGDTQARVLIRGDELITTVSLPADPVLPESGTSNVTAALLVGNPGAGRTASMALANGSATSGTDLTLTNPALDLSVRSPALPLQAMDDALTESDETFHLILTNAGPRVKLLPALAEPLVPAIPPPAGLAVQGDWLATADGAGLKILRRNGDNWLVDAEFPATAEGGVYAVAMDQEMIAADFLNTGVKIFTREAGSWTLTQTLPRASTPPDQRRVLVLQDDTLAIGDPQPAGETALSGEVRVYERHLGGRGAWGLRGVIGPAAVQPDFGSSLSLWGDFLVSGAPESFSVLLLQRSGTPRSWSPVREFVRMVPGFGKFHAIDGDTLVMPLTNATLTSRKLNPGEAAWSEPLLQPNMPWSVNSRITLQGGLLSGFSNNTNLAFYTTTTSGAWVSSGSIRQPASTSTIARVYAFDGTTAVLPGNGDEVSTPLLTYRSPATQGLLIDDETVLFTADDASFTGGYYPTTVRLSRPLPFYATVGVTTVDGTATAGTDYNATASNVTFNPGATTANLFLSTVAPADGAAVKTFGLRLANPSIGTAGPDGLITIRPAPTTRLEPPFFPIPVSEGHGGLTPVTVTLTLSGPAPAGASYGWYLAGDTAKAGSDFPADTSGIVNIPEGATTSSFIVPVLGDTTGERDEQFFVMLTDLTELQLAQFAQAKAAIQINNDDTGIPVNDTYTIPQGTILSGMDVRANDTRIDQVQLLDQSSLPGSLTLNPLGIFTFTPSPNLIGPASFLYQDSYTLTGLNPAHATVLIHVTDGHLPPQLKADSYNVKEDSVLENGTKLLANDGLFNEGGSAYDPILEMSVQDVQNGTLANYEAGDGRFVFTPAPDFSGTAGFRYRVRDKDGWSAPAQVNIFVADDLPLNPLQALYPPGSQLYRSTVSANAVTFPLAGVFDYPLALTSGQTVSLRMATSSSAVLGRLEVQDLSGKVLPGGTAGVNSLEHVPIPADGVYKIIAGQRSGFGSGSLTLLINGGLPGQPSNAAAPYSLDRARPAGSLRAAVAATQGSSPHQYSFTGPAGETVKIYLQSSLLHTFKLQNDEGTVLASSAVSAHDPKASFLSFLLPATGPYRLVVTGANAADYTLQLYHGAETHEYAGAALVPLGPKNAGYLSGRGLPAGGTPEAAVTFAAFADYGSGSANEAAVSTMVKSWNPDFIIAAGDHNYSLDYTIGTPSWTTAVGTFYGSFIKARADHRYPEQTSPIQRYFTVPGNHDSGPDPANGGELSSYLDYFHSNPGSVPRLPPGVHQPRLSYYKMTWGNADFFFLDSDNASVDSAALTAQRQWLKARLSDSTAQWKFGVWHHPPYSSGGSHGSHPFIQWGADFQGLTAIITGHDHIYERLDAGFGVTQFITGIGGNSFYSFATTPVSNSLFRYNANHGALKVIATASGVQFDFRTIGPAGGALIDSYTVGTPPNPVVPTGTDTWSLPVRRGQTLHLTTRTPESPGPLRNTADPVIQVLDPSGTIVASDAGSAGDGINASLTYTIPLLPGAPVPPTGWTVRVVSESNGSGEYELLITEPAEEAYQAWAALQPAGWTSQPEADPDFDGLPNLMEYLLESNPALAATPIASALELLSGSPPVLQIHLPDDWTRPVTAYLQSSPQLDAGTWATLARKPAGVGPWLGDGPELPQPAPAGGYTFTPPSGPRQFYRLAFTLN